MPRVRIEREALYKLRRFVKLAEKEIGGVLELEDLGNDEYLVKDVIIIKQVVSAGDFEVDSDELAKFSKDLFKNDPDKMGRIRGWWHKHPITGWSFQDNTTFERLSKFFGGFCLGVVWQEPKKKFLWRVDVQKKIHSGFFVSMFNTEKYHLHGSNDFDRKLINQECKDNIEELVQERVWVTKHTKTWNQGKLDWDGYDDWGQTHGTYDKGGSGIKSVLCPLCITDNNNFEGLATEVMCYGCKNFFDPQECLATGNVIYWGDDDEPMDELEKMKADFGCAATDSCKDCGALSFCTDNIDKHRLYNLGDKVQDSTDHYGCTCKTKSKHCRDCYDRYMKDKGLT